MRELKTDFEKKRDKNLRAIKKAVLWLRKHSYTIEAQETETMIGTAITHIYTRLRSSKGSIWEQRHLFTLDEIKSSKKDRSIK